MGAEQPESRLILDLPTPKRGMLAQVFGEIMTGRVRFVGEERERMGVGNEHLYEWLMENCIITPDGRLSLDWALMYYAIHARSTDEDGMPIVSADLISTEFESNLDELNLEIRPVTEDTREVFEVEAKRIRDYVLEKDKGRGREVNRFWDSLKGRRASLEEARNYSSIVARWVFDPTYDLAYLLHNQIHSNRLEKKHNPMDTDSVTKQFPEL